MYVCWVNRKCLDIANSLSFSCYRSLSGDFTAGIGFNRFFRSRIRVLFWKWTSLSYLAKHFHRKYTCHIFTNYSTHLKVSLFSVLSWNLPAWVYQWRGSYFPQTAHFLPSHIVLQALASFKILNKPRVSPVVLYLNCSLTQSAQQYQLLYFCYVAKVSTCH